LHALHSLGAAHIYVMQHERRSLKVCTRLGRFTIAPSSSASSGR
jgi:hypothetical protein